MSKSLLKRSLLRRSNSGGQWISPMVCSVSLGSCLRECLSPTIKLYEGPPGFRFLFARNVIDAGFYSFSRWGFLAIEVLTLTGLYLYSIDHRSSAHLCVRTLAGLVRILLIGPQIGHAIRVAQMEGMHTNLPEAELGCETLALVETSGGLYTFLIDTYHPPSLFL
ncbi:hypothetical protein BDW59DRAFT_35917 [Aspergillus cavernicola]|uniref:Uncharacterized protein n=1 Tax=Aspergillus cavernicola TaxID=176166 RepID=A0ABR4INV9_9EURO